MAGAVTAAAAPVDPNKSYNNEPEWNPAIQGKRATQVLSLSVPNANYKLLQVNSPTGFDSGNAAANNGTISLWEKAWDNSDYHVLAANELWEFVPAPDNSGGTINSGYGWLRNRASGKCLDVTGAPTGVLSASIAQYDCMDDLNHENQLWRINNNQRLQVKYNGFVLQAGSSLSFNGACSSSNAINGTAVGVVPEQFSCDGVVASKERYYFATNRMQTSSVLTSLSDDAIYRCLPGWDWDYMNSFHVNISYMYIGDEMSSVPGAGMILAFRQDDGGAIVGYSDYDMWKKTYQVRLLCLQ